MVDTAPSPGTAGSPLPDRSVVPPVWGRITNLIVDHGEGSWLVTPEGDRYLDYTSGIGVTNTGHAHPRVVAAIQAQAARLLHGQQNIVYHEPGLRLYDRLAHLLPGGPWTAFLSNSGAEAVEAAVKLARVATGRPAIIAFRYGFHGRTAQAMALTAAKDVYRGAFEPLPGSVYHAAYPYCYRAAGGPHDPSACTCDWEEQLDLLFHQLVFPDRVAAIIVEPVIGEGGYLVPPPGFLPRLRELTRQHGILLIADEVQTGFGRTGELFAVQHWDVEPDIMLTAKGIGSGMPVGAMLAKSELMSWGPGAHGSTYGGNPVALAALLETVRLLEGGLMANASIRGREIMEALAPLREQYPELVKDVRGKGLMIGVQFDSGETADAVQMRAFDMGLLVLEAGDDCVRMSPALVVSQSEASTAVRLFSEAVAHVAANRGADVAKHASEVKAGFATEGFGASG